MKTIKTIFLLAFMTVVLNGCLGDLPVYHQENVALIINQGNFSDKNGSISYYFEESGAVENDLLKRANNNTDMGAIIQSMEVTDSEMMYVVCNSVDKIEVFDVRSGKRMMNPYAGDDLSTPRYLTGDARYLYITNWGEGVDNGFGWEVYPDAYVLVLDRTNNWSTVRKIACGSDAEEILYLSNMNKLYVATGEGVAVIDLPSYHVGLIETPVGLFGGAKSIVLSQGNLLWASYPDDQKLVAINLLNNTVHNVYDMPLDWMGQIVSNSTGTKIYSYKTEFDASYNPLWAAIYEFDVATGTYKEFFKGVAGSYFFGVGVSPYTGNVYTANVNNFISNSLLLVIDPFGVKIDEKTVGVGTCGMRFMSFLKQ